MMSGTLASSGPPPLSQEEDANERIDTQQQRTRMKSMKATGLEWYESIKGIGVWTAHRVASLAGTAAADTQVPPDTTFTPDSEKALRSATSGEPMGMASPRRSAENGTAWKFVVGDTVIVSEGAMLSEGTCVTVTAPPEGGVVSVRSGVDVVELDTSLLLHPVTTFRVLGVGCDVHSAASRVSPVFRRVLGGDCVGVLRAVEGAVYWLQTLDGGYIEACSKLTPIYLPGLCIKVLETTVFDNGRKVSAGCLGVVTKTPGDVANTVAEVLVDGVVWDASSSQVSPLIPQSQCTLIECCGTAVIQSDSESESEPTRSKDVSISEDDEDDDSLDSGL